MVSTLFKDYCNNKFINYNRLQQQERHHDEDTSFTFDIDNETTIRSTTTSSRSMVMFFRQFISSSSAAVLTATTTLLSLPPSPLLLASVLGPPAPNSAAASSSSTFVVVSGFSPSSSSLSLQFAPSRQILQQISLRQQQQTTSSFAFFWGGGGGGTTSRISQSKRASGTADDDEQLKEPVVRIGIIGGGIVGVSSAHALAERRRQQLLQSGYDMDITILEAGMPPSPSSRREAAAAAATANSNQQPTWKAATARNGNSIVPGASFSVLSQRSTLFGVLKDTAREMYQLAFYNKTQNENENIDINNEQFATVPPYFALHLYKCLVGTGPGTTNEERMSFVRFISQYLYYSIMKGGKEDASIRSRHIGTLAKSNRNIYDNIINNNVANASLADSIGHSRGFLSIHRSKEEAQATLQHVRSVGEEAHLVENWETACEIEPHLRNIPSIMQPLFVVRRPNDYTANCNAFTRYWIDSCSQNLVGVRHVMANAKKIIRTTTKKDKDRKNIFRVIAKDGNVYEFDILVLAAGINTPLLASQLNAAKYCPTYPLRGFSLTIYFPSRSKGSSKDGEEKQNLLRQPFKLDSMYCTSVSPTIARWVGFGEFAGYRTADDVPSIAPSVLKRYAKMIFPEAANISNDAAMTETEAVACFRAMSPDDLPVVGEVPTVDNLFLNSGHGSLGWTVGLATGEMLAQAVERKLQQQSGEDDKEEKEAITYTLSDGSQFDPKVYSPSRFA